MREQKITLKKIGVLGAGAVGAYLIWEFPCLPLYGPTNEESIKEAARTFDVKFEKADYEF